MVARPVPRRQHDEGAAAVPVPGAVEDRPHAGRRRASRIGLEESPGREGEPEDARDERRAEHVSAYGVPVDAFAVSLDLRSGLVAGPSSAANAAPRLRGVATSVATAAQTPAMNGVAVVNAACHANPMAAWRTSWRLSACSATIDAKVTTPRRSAASGRRQHAYGHHERGDREGGEPDGDEADQGRRGLVARLSQGQRQRDARTGKPAHAILPAVRRGEDRHEQEPPRDGEEVAHRGAARWSEA